MNLSENVNLLKIVITGPESSGKTTLAQDLAARLNARWVPEFARSYLAHLGRPYEHNDLKAIRLGQAAWEKWYEHLSMQEWEKSEENRKNAQPLLICDTDWTVLHIWEQYKYDPTLSYPTLPATSSLHAFYLLCAPDIPWQPDPLREHPEERETLFDLYQNLLMRINTPYAIVRGNPTQRLQTALAAIREVLFPVRRNAIPAP